jgi:acetyl-CoA synthetase
MVQAMLAKRPAVGSQRSDKARKTDHYDRIWRDFRWFVPTKMSMAHECCTRWAERPDAASRVAIRAYDAGSQAVVEYSFGQLQAAADALSRRLLRAGVRQGDRVAIVMPQRFETAVAYIAILQIGAVAMPLSMLFGPDALQYRLHNSQAVAAVVDAAALEALRRARAEGEGAGHLRQIWVVGLAQGGLAQSVLGLDAKQGELDYADEIRVGAEDSTLPQAMRADTHAEDAAVLIYTSGTTGPPKGALIPQRALIGNLTGFVASQNWFGFDGRGNAGTEAVFWSPADWAWTGGLMDALLPTLYFGRPIVAFAGRFDPIVALELMRSCQVTHTFLFPTALKAMMKAASGQGGTTVRQQYGLKLAAIMSAGEAVGDAVFAYCEQQLGVRPNEMFGQTEINYIVGNCNRFWPSKPGSMGKAYPGHRVEVIDDSGNPCPEGVIGEVAVNRFDVHGQPDPVFFLGYWRNEAATQAKFTGDWGRTGDLALRDADGYLWYQGRSDDMFKAAGYRIGPGEVENCLVKHPAVANAAVVPKPDLDRGAVVKAYVVLAPDFVAARGRLLGDAAQLDQYDQAIIKQLQAHVKGKLAPYEYPKEIEFVDALPMTTTGKVQRRVLRLQEESRFQSSKQA